VVQGNNPQENNIYIEKIEIRSSYPGKEMNGII
jgi:hypothetical protein